MKKILKQFSIVLLALFFILPLFLFVGCNSGGLKLDDSMQNSAIESQYGFVTKIGNYVYFINGSQDYQADNKFGKVVKGALMRTTVEGLRDNTTPAEMVVPELIVSADYDSGIVIYNGRVYYASPNSTKNLQGQIEKDFLDFKSAKLDGTDVRNHGRAGENKAPYRFVVVDERVYLVYLHETGSTKEIHSVDTYSNTDTVLVKDYDSAILAEDKNVNAKYVYYTMQVVNPTSKPKTYNRNHKDYSTPSVYSYRQLYRVDITGKGTNTAQIKNINTESLRNAGYVAEDDSVLDYCNQGELLYDGISMNNQKTIFNIDKPQSDAAIQDLGVELMHYYSKQNYATGTYENDGSGIGTVFFRVYGLNDTNSGVIYAFNEAKYTEKNDKTGEYLPYKLGETDTDILKRDFNEVLTPVFIKNGQNSTIFSSVVVQPYHVDDTDKGFVYMMRSGSDSSETGSSSGATAIVLRKVKQGDAITSNATGTEQILTRTDVSSDSEVLFIEGNDLYYNAGGSSGKTLYKVAFKEGENNTVVTGLQNGIQFLNIEYNSSWYKPEVLTISENEEYLFFANNSTYGENYVNVLRTKGTVQNTTNTSGPNAYLVELNRGWKAIQDAFNFIENATYIPTFSDYKTTTLNLMKFYFYTGYQLSATETVKFAGRPLKEFYNQLVSDSKEGAVEYAKLFIEDRSHGAISFKPYNLPKNDRQLTMTESDFYHMIGRRADDGSQRQQDIATALLPSLPVVTGWTWQWWALFVPIGVFVVAVATVTPLLVIHNKKKKVNRINQVLNVVEKR